MLPQAVRVVPASRFGNRVIELVHALDYGAILGIQMIYISFNFLYINRTVNTTTGVMLCMDKQLPGQRVLVGVFYNRLQLTQCSMVNYIAIVATFRRFVLENLPHLSLPVTTIFAYIRGGDIFISPIKRERPRLHRSSNAQVSLPIVIIMEREFPFFPTQTPPVRL
jgi:hypothetical protein